MRKIISAKSSAIAAPIVRLTYADYILACFAAGCVSFDLFYGLFSYIH